MPPLTRFAAAAGTLVTLLADLIDAEWKPVEMDTELQYRNDLIAFLRANVPDDARLEKEYRHGGTTADIYLHWKGVLWDDSVFIEIKRNLTQKTNYDRLIGQIEGMNPGKNNVILVLVGESDKGLVGRISEKYVDELRSLSTGMRLVRTKPRKPRAKKAKA